MVSKKLPDFLQVEALHSIGDVDFDQEKPFSRNGSQLEASTVSVIAARGRGADHTTWDESSPARLSPAGLKSSDSRNAKW